MVVSDYFLFNQWIHNQTTTTKIMMMMMIIQSTKRT